VDSVKIHFDGVGEFTGSLTALTARMHAATNTGLLEAGHAVEAQAKTNASGRPGPNVVSGTLRRSIHVEGPANAGSLGRKVEVGPSVIYGRRVELGFSGTDSRGRSYDQPPYPYLGPALDALRPTVLPEILNRAWAAAIAG
jgi:hypothetical protein